MFNAIFKELVGKDISGLNGDALLFNESMLYDINMGFYKPEGITPFSSSEYRSIEHEYTHPWSLKETGRFFGLHKLKDLIPLKDFVTLPNCVLDDLIAGVTQGETDRLELDRQYEASKPTQQVVDKEILRQFKEAGLEIPKL